jgi:DNA-binding NarL/FixJ family response regulator
LDISFPDGSSVNLLPEITSKYPGLKILLFSMHPRPLFDNILKKYKHIDFCEKNESESSVTEHIKRFFRGEYAYKPTRKARGLGKRETQIMDLMMKGYSTQMIAQELGLKSNTISTFKGRIFRKLNANNLVDLVRIYG